MIDQAQNLRKMVFSKQNSIKDDTSKQSDSILVYTITSGKGGVGKSNFTVNLALQMQRRGRKVLIIDADYGMANINILLGISINKTLHDVIFKGVPLEDAIIENEDGIKIISGGSGLLEMTELSNEKQQRLIDGLSKLDNIDTILIDTSAGVSKNLLSFISFSQEMILVTTPEPTSLTDAYSLMKIVSKLQIKNSIKVVINKAQSKKSSELAFERLERAVMRFLDIKLEKIGYISEDKKVQEAVMTQVPFTKSYPKCTASENVLSIIDNLFNEHTSKKELSSMKQVISRMLKVFS
ncbi:MinD/ParA family protein [Clostridium sediminicola]|uniref:MinD/ParA family protein n=1 Tax=Clostridium sediminicola TaxID=3114879 RepID=UPI0031F24986